MNIQILLQMTADAIGERIAIQVDRASLSYADLQLKSERAAGWLTQQAGARLVYVGLNQLAFPVALFASAMAGRSFVPLNYRLADRELRALIERCSPAVLVVDPEFENRVSGIPGIQSIGSRDFLDLSDRSAALQEAATDPDEVAVQLFTSGTTGQPKAALLRHRHLSTYVIETVEFMCADESDALLVSVPPYHIAGIASILSSVYAGRRTVVLPSFSPRAWISTAQSESATHAMLVPTMLSRLVTDFDPDRDTLPRLRHLAYGGGRMPIPIIQKAMALLPHVGFVNAYGLTETSSTIAVLGPEDHRAALAGSTEAARARLGSVGRPLPNLELSIRGSDGQPVPAGTSGEIWVRGAQVSGEYAGLKTIREDGWLPTRDAGWLDPEGFLFVEGRLDDVIVRGGENISPGEVEEVLMRHPAIRDAAVFGVPDVEWGEKIAAAVVVSEPVAATNLQDWVRVNLRSSRTPEIVVFRDELPYNETGKLLRRALREELAADPG